MEATMSDWKTWQIQKNDTFLGFGELQGEGQWVHSYLFEDPKGDQYEVWVDQDGDSKVVE